MAQATVYSLLYGGKIPIVNRVNNSSEARDDPDLRYNRSRFSAGRCADHSVFISQWLRDVYANNGLLLEASSVIHNGGDTSLFRSSETQKDLSKPVSIVTHHWSSNAKKGFDIYVQLDRLIHEKRLPFECSFTYIGNIPEGVAFNATHCRGVLSPQEIAKELPKHNIYITAARNEGAGMHHIEAALCGLPILYIESGALPEYCGGFGEVYNLQSLENALRRIVDRYQEYRLRLNSYPFTAEVMCERYFKLFENLVGTRSTRSAGLTFFRRLLHLAGLFHVK
jgi:hypothetical protein